LDQKTDADGRTRRRFRLHDLLHDYAVRVAGEPKLLHQKLLDAYAKKCPDGWPTGPNDGYFIPRIFFHAESADSLDVLEDMICDFKLISRLVAGEGYVTSVFFKERLEKFVSDHRHPKPKIQNILKNIDCFTTCLRMLEHTAYDPKALCKECGQHSIVHGTIDSGSGEYYDNCIVLCTNCYWSWFWAGPDYMGDSEPKFDYSTNTY